ncbi:hypothetical protein GCM10007962_14810 [Yeosuana aromativorans]|uniref:Outer membrane protein beta-barrel domain-containing protein n=1 Tax=Yeosuana aromativorans TaxID=288019 RepID=A0A8J3FFS9_9FLAO|nr:hypothetical protein [Yeosuana aromativorans]GGK21664.1 hypothetical protein GCM10007962_14810 [Yeosuana aromativorans]
MRKIIFSCLLVFSFIYVSAQEQYTVNGTTYQLKTAVEGHLDLLYNTINKQYRYFVRTKDGNITELTNTKGPDKHFQAEYKSQLADLTKDSSVSTSDLNFTLSDLEEFIKTYNASLGDSYNDTKATVKLRLGLFGGITNQPFVSNPNNTSVPFFGAELEGLSSMSSRHAGFFNITHALDHDDFQYTSTQLGLGYRYRFINQTVFNVYGNLTLATYTFSKQTYMLIGAPSETVKESNFQIPCSFGLGADIKVGSSGFITLAYNELFAVFTNNSNNFPVNVAIGYKFSL